ncbi:sarcospan [Ambystoma mexicanum]|uniref:sarcospan n=1 Tax=Ambystoma mexicanum TaxID=8296 RepID=UPI0037E75360
MGEKDVSTNQNLDTRTMEQLTDDERRTQKKKKGETAKAGQEEDSHTCCGCRFPLLVALLQLGLGSSVTALAFVMTASSSSFLVRDTPHWAGIFVCVVAVLGLCMFCLTYQADETTCCKFALKLAYFLLSALSLTVCMLAIAFSAYHYSLLTQMTCEMADDSSCQCKLNALDPLSRSFMYQDVSDCGTVTGTIKLYVLVQIILNLLLGLVCLVACFIMWRDRYQVFYVGVRLRTLTTSEERQKV